MRPVKPKGIPKGILMILTEIIYATHEINKDEIVNTIFDTKVLLQIE